MRLGIAHSSARGAQLNEAEGTPQVNVFGVKINLVTPPRLVEFVDEAVKSRAKRRIAFCSVHGVMESQSSPVLRSALNTVDVAAPDGLPLVWYIHRLGFKNIERTAGPDFMPLAFENGVVRGWRHYLYGSTESILEALTLNLKQTYPGTQIVGSYSPPFRPLTDDETSVVAAQINAANPDLVWVGLGMPRQELWMAEFQARLDAPVLLGVGAAFEILAGKRKRAPAWMRRHGLEWLHRFAQEPRRLWRRYLLCSRFIWMALNPFRSRTDLPE